MLLESGPLPEYAAEVGVLGHPLDLEDLLPLQVDILLPQPLLVQLPYVDGLLQLVGLLPHLRKCHLLNLVPITLAQPREVPADLGELVEGLQNEVEVEGGRDSLAQVEGQQLTPRLLSHDQDVHVPVDVGISCRSDDPHAPQHVVLAVHWHGGRFGHC